MILRIPSGTRDVLPDETREVRAITAALLAVFGGHGYGELSTPALEYESVLAHAELKEARPAYRVFDESGAVLVLRSDMTVPIARVAATRYPYAELPLRFCTSPTATGASVPGGDSPASYCRRASSCSGRRPPTARPRR